MTEHKHQTGPGNVLGFWRWVVLGTLFLLCALALSGFIYILISDPPIEALAVADHEVSTTTLTWTLETTPTSSLTKFLSPTTTLTPLPTATKYIPRYGTATPTRTPVTVPTRYISPTPGGRARIEGLVGHKQSLPLSCEASAAVDWAAFFGVKIDELEFFDLIPQSDNPDKGFVGDVNGAWGQIPPAPYGVHAEPVAQVLRAYGLPAQARFKISWEEVKAEISTGHPVIVWVSGHVVKGTPVPFMTSDGYSTIVTRFEHTVMVTGYSDELVWILDGAQEYARSIKVFLESWGVLGNMAIIWRE